MAIILRGNRNGRATGNSYRCTIHVDAIAILNDNRDAFHRNFDAITEPRFRSTSKQPISPSRGGCSSVASYRFHGEMLDKYIYIVFIKLFLQNFVYRVLLYIYYSFYLNTMHSLRFDSTEHLQSTINRQISHTKKEKRLSSFDYNGTC